MSKISCSKCGQETKNKKFCSRECANSYLSGGMEKRSHQRDWEAIQKAHDRGIRVHDLLKEFKMSWGVLNKAVSQGLFVRKYIQRKKASEETRRIMSERKKQWCKDNPDKPVWRNPNRFKSPPCEKLKDAIRKNGLVFIEEYMPLKDRSFSIDIAFPEKKIGIEVNGNQHYDKNTGLLLPYYQDRHELIEKEMWRLIEVHFSMVYNEAFVNGMIADLKCDGIITEIDPQKYEIARIDKLAQFPNRTKPQSYCSSCNKKITKNSKSGLCRSCFDISRNKGVRNCLTCDSPVGFHGKTAKCVNCCALDSRYVNRPLKEDLEKLIIEMPMIHIGKKFGVSDTAIRKWCIKYGISYKKTRRTPVYCGCGKRIDFDVKSGKCRVCLINEKRPPKEELADAISNGSIRKVATKYGVDRGLIARWCRDYGLEK